MGKALRIQLFKILVLILALNCTQPFKSFGQVPLVDLRSFEISFTPGESSRERSGVNLSMQEAKRMSGLEIDDGQPFEFTADTDRQEGFFYANSPGGPALGRYYHTGYNNILSQIPIRNGTPANISGISLAFDFIYLPVQDDPGVSFQLSYRVNGGEWTSPSGGFFTSRLLQKNGPEWNSLSIQINLEELYLLPNDQLEIRWVAGGIDDISDFIPIALQKVELFASEAEKRDIYPGSLIISEIMTSFDAGAGNLEYVEIYNSTENPINLKGLVLQSATKRVVVQRDITAEPFEAVLFAGYAGNDERFATLADYRYGEQLLLENTGRITLSMDGRDIARALYESQNPGTSIQLNHLENAFDGYSSLSHFETATAEWNSELTGTPGRVEPERKLFSKYIESPGWYLLGSPGRLTESANRDVLNNLTPIQSINSDSGNEELQSPFVYHHSDSDDPVRLFASGGTTGGKVSGSQEAEQGTPAAGYSFESLSVDRVSGIDEIVSADGKQAYPALLTWDASKQAFGMVWQETDRVKPWNSYLLRNRSAAEQVSDGLSNREGGWTGLSRHIGISLEPDADSESDVTEYDNTIIGFWEAAPQEGENAGYTLPKLWTPLSEPALESRSPMIYLKTADAPLPSSYLNFPATPGENIQVSVGLKLPSSVNRAQFRWNHIESLPEQWEIEFVDADIGERVNMRKQNHYLFSERSDKVRDGMNDPGRSFTQVEPDDYSRFYIRISPTGDLETFEAETESPESVELKQNYPNPFNPTTTIGFYLPVATDVRIAVYNVVGQQVGQLVDDRLSAGDHTVSWNALDMPSGVYIVQLEAMNSVQTRKITLIK